HGLEVRHVLDRARLVDQQGGGHDRQGGVLGTGDAHFTSERGAAVDAQQIHQGAGVVSDRAWIALPMRSPSAAYTMRCCSTVPSPAKLGEITSAAKCTPSSPRTSTVASGRPAWINSRICSALYMAGFTH